MLSTYDPRDSVNLDNWRDPGYDLPPLRLTISASDYILDADTAKSLAEFKGELNLSGLTTLDAATAKALAGAPAWNGDLSSITAFESPDSVETAAALAKRKGPLTLPNLKKISSKTLTALIEKEDVMLPKEFQTRQKARQQGR